MVIIIKSIVISIYIRIYISIYNIFISIYVINRIVSIIICIVNRIVVINVIVSIDFIIVLWLYHSKWTNFILWLYLQWWIRYILNKIKIQCITIITYTFIPTPNTSNIPDIPNITIPYITITCIKYSSNFLIILWLLNPWIRLIIRYQSTTITNIS